MFRSWRKRAFLLIAITLLITSISFNSVLAQEVPSTNTNNSSSPNIEKIYPIERTRAVPSTEDNRKVTPSNEGQATPKAKSSRDNSSRPSDPYEKYYDAIKKFNEELYGEKG